jgi:protein-L-isoaspartate(D-aspartate) O-methyltransferase
MIAEQLEPRGIRDATVLAAFAKVDRALFVPPEYQEFAYSDQALPIGLGQTISQPFVVAKMTELLCLSKKDKVLEIGTGSGYQSAILAELAGEVFSLEIVEPLHLRAATLLQELGYANARAILADGYGGYPLAAPFSAITVTAAPSRVPEALLSQLAPGGRMVIPVGTEYQSLYFIKKDTNGNVEFNKVFPVLFVPMQNAPQPKRQ